MSAPKLRADMPDPRPLNTAAWKADAAQKVRATALSAQRLMRLRFKAHAPVLTPQNSLPPPPPSNFPCAQVFDFLTETAYPQRVSTKLLLGPTAKDFQAIITHIARTLDNHYVMTGKLEDEVAALAKALNYPFTPSKTAIATVGAAHSWPPLLGMLVWMTDLARYHSCLRGRQEEDEAALLSALASGGGGGARSAASHAVVGTSEHFWWYIREAYSAYLAGEDEAVEATEQGISAAFDGAAAAAEADTAAAERALASSAGELEALAGGQSVLPTLRSAAGEIAGDVGRLQSALKEMEAYRDSLAKKRSDKAEEIAGLEGELARARGEAERIQGIVQGQELSQEDVRRLKAQASALRERQGALSAERAGMEVAIAGGREELKRCLSAVRLFFACAVCCATPWASAAQGCLRAGPLLTRCLSPPPFSLSPPSLSLFCSWSCASRTTMKRPGACSLCPAAQSGPLMWTLRCGWMSAAWRRRCRCPLAQRQRAATCRASGALQPARW